MLRNSDANVKFANVMALTGHRIFMLKSIAANEWTSVALPSSVATAVYSCAIAHACLDGSCLWNLLCKSLHSLEVAFNNCLQKIWRLPRNIVILFYTFACHLHCFLVVCAINTNNNNNY